MMGVSGMKGECWGVERWEGGVDLLRFGRSVKGSPCLNSRVGVGLLLTVRNFRAAVQVKISQGQGGMDRGRRGPMRIISLKKKK